MAASTAGIMSSYWASCSCWGKKSGGRMRGLWSWRCLSPGSRRWPWWAMRPSPVRGVGTRWTWPSRIMMRLRTRMRPPLPGFGRFRSTMLRRASHTRRAPSPALRVSAVWAPWSRRGVINQRVTIDAQLTYLFTLSFCHIKLVTQATMRTIDYAPRMLEQLQNLLTSFNNLDLIRSRFDFSVNIIIKYRG